MRTSVLTRRIPIAVDRVLERLLDDGRRPRIVAGNEGLAEGATAGGARLGRLRARADLLALRLLVGMDLDVPELGVAGRELEYVSLNRCS